MGILMSAYVGDTDAQAQAEAKEGVWYFLKNCLKGHLRREGRQLTFGPGIPYIPPEEFRNYLKFSDPTSPLLGDAENWDDLQQSASIIVGSADTVYRRIMEILEQTKVGQLLIQFHLGNMADELTRKSMQRFATEVAPRLREAPRNCSRANFPTWNGSSRRSRRREPTQPGCPRAARSTCSRPAPAIRWSICTASPTCTAWPRICSRFTNNSAKPPGVIAPAHPGCAGSDELPDGCSIDDVLFHYLEVFDALGLQRFDLVGHCAGGWIAAELAVRHPEKIARLVLIGACGLFVPGEPIGDVFMHAQPERGTDYQSLRTLLFSAADAPAALRFFPDGRGDIDEEMRRYQMLRFGSFVGLQAALLLQPRAARAAASRRDAGAGGLGR